MFTAVFNGVAAVPLLFLIAKINGSPQILGNHQGGVLSRTFVWGTFGVMGFLQWHCCTRWLFSTLHIRGNSLEAVEYEKISAIADLAIVERRVCLTWTKDS